MSDFDLDAFLPYQLNVLASRTSRAFSKLYRERFAISVAEWRVAAHLSQTGPVSVREIHARVDMDKSKVSRAAQRLEAAGYIRKCTHPGDRRLVEMSLTAKGRAMMAEMAPLAVGFQEELLADLGIEGADFREAIMRLLRRVA